MASIPERERAAVAAHDAQRARHLWMLEFGSPKEFNDPSLAYRRLFAELLGTFMLVLVAAGGGVLHAGSATPGMPQAAIHLCCAGTSHQP